MGANSLPSTYFSSKVQSVSATMASDTSADKPVVAVGEKITVYWPSSGDGTTEGGPTKATAAEVMYVVKTEKKKQGSFYKYELCFYKENSRMVSTRLVNLKWERRGVKASAKRNSSTLESSGTSTKYGESTLAEHKQKKHKKEHLSKAPPAAASTTSSVYQKSSSKHQVSNKTNALAPENLQHIVAPMVGASELAFRLLCRKYGATLAYTPMMNSEKFATDAEYREAELQSCPEDRPLVAHFSANCPKTFLAAAKLAEDKCDAIGEF